MLYLMSYVYMFYIHVHVYVCKLLLRHINTVTPNCVVYYLDEHFLQT